MGGRLQLQRTGRPEASSPVVAQPDPLCTAGHELFPVHDGCRQATRPGTRRHLRGLPCGCSQTGCGENSYAAAFARSFHEARRHRPSTSYHTRGRAAASRQRDHSMPEELMNLALQPDFVDITRSMQHMDARNGGLPADFRPTRRYQEIAPDRTPRRTCPHRPRLDHIRCPARPAHGSRLATGIRAARGSRPFRRRIAKLQPVRGPASCAGIRTAAGDRARASDQPCEHRRRHRPHPVEVGVPMKIARFAPRIPSVSRFVHDLCNPADPGGRRPPGARHARRAHE